MPVAPQFQIVQMRELCDQLKIAPEHIRRKQMDACELLASEIESEHLYPLDYVIFRLTGYRTESVDQPMLLGDPLRNDLVALVAILSRGLHLPSENMLSAQEVADLFGVSKRTISRLRKEGLVFHWVVERDGRRRIGCNKQTAEDFFKTHKERLRTATKFSQLSLVEQKTIIDAASHYEGSELTLNALASELAKKNHRGTETIRLLLKHSDQTNPVYNYLPPLTSKDAALIHRAIRMGIRWKTLQQRYRRTSAAMRKAVLRMKTQNFRDDLIPYVEMPSFKRKDGADVILGVDVVTDSQPLECTVTVESTSNYSELLQRDELAIVSAMHLLNYRSAHSISSLPYSPNARMIDRIETDLRWSFLLQQQLVLSTLQAGLAVFVQHLGRPLSELPLQQSLAITRRAITTIWDVVSTVDPTKGQKVTRIATSHLDRLLSREQSLERTRRASAIRKIASLPFPCSEVVSWSRVLPHLEPEKLPSDVRELYEMRFGWRGKPKSIAEMASLLTRSESSIVRALRKW